MARVEGPGGPAELAQPIVRGRAVGLGIAPDVPVPLEALPRGSALKKPWMSVRGVVRYEVEDHLEPARVGLSYKAVEVGQCAKKRVDVAVVGDVVAEVGHGRGIDRRNPEPVHAEPGEVVEPAADTVKVADAVAVRVLKRTGINLVNHLTLPPRRRAATIHSHRVLLRDAFQSGPSGNSQRAHLVGPERTRRQQGHRGWSSKARSRL